MKIYTRKGDDGTTGLLYGGRVGKDSPATEALRAVDEAQAVLGSARAAARAAGGTGGELDELLVAIERDLWVLMAELATDPADHDKLTPGASLVTGEMVEALEHRIDELTARFEAPTEFVVPGQTTIGAWLDLGRTVIRRAERRAIAASADAGPAIAYLNRLSDLLWAAARWQEADELLLARDVATRVQGPVDP